MTEKEKPKVKLFFLWGLSIGLASLVRPVFNYFWIVLLPLIGFRYGIKKGVCFFAVCLLGIILFVGPWIGRNYYTAGFYGLQSTEGVSLLWGNHQLTRPSTEKDYETDPILAKVRDVIESSENPMKILTPLKKDLNLDSYELNALLRNIGIENILSNPIDFSKIYFRNFIKTLTTLLNKSQPKGIGSIFPKYIVWAEKIISFILFIGIPIFIIPVAWKKEKFKFFAIFGGILILYFLFLSSFVDGSFRYRLPLHSIFWILNAFFFEMIWNKISVGINNRSVA